MSIIGTALSLASPEDIVKIVATYGPAIEALIEFIEMHHDEKVRAQSMDSITRGFQIAKQTGDPSEVQAAIRSHCTPDGCRIL